MHQSLTPRQNGQKPALVIMFYYISEAYYGKIHGGGILFPLKRLSDFSVFSIPIIFELIGVRGF